MKNPMRHRRPTYWSKSYVDKEGNSWSVGATTFHCNDNRVPSKAAGRKGTRRDYKRTHPPGWQAKLWTRIFP